MVKGDDHRAEMRARAARRAERTERHVDEYVVPPRVVNVYDNTDVGRVKAAHDKRTRRRLRNMEQAANQARRGSHDHLRHRG